MDSVQQILKKIQFPDRPYPLNNHKGKKGFRGEKKGLIGDGWGFSAMAQNFPGNFFHSGI